VDDFEIPRSWRAGIACAVLALFLSLARAHAGVKSHVFDVARDGEWALYLSGHAYHVRRSYPRDLVALLNEDAWGGGFGRTLRLKDGGLASLAFTAFEDSLGGIEYNLGYIREWRTRPLAGHLVLGAGLSVFLTSRTDFFEGKPFPALLPLVSAEVGRVALIATYVPRLPSRNGEGGGFPEIYGDVFYVFSRIRFY
jgi:palmitoyl transferase